MKNTIKNTSVALVLGFVALSSFNAQASSEQYLSKSTQELNVSGNLNFDTDNYNVATRYGYFVADDWEIGGDVNVGLSDETDTVDVSMFTQYNFTNSTDFVPYVGISAGVLSADNGNSNLLQQDDDAFVFSTQLGVKYFVTKNVALSAEFEQSWSNLEVDGLSDSFSEVRIGTSFYF
ncbi:outer membrane beta-barrel protein [Aeromonas enteropelogenes]|uniref:outer membrane beta-barrel protein n=1 Tax=Aeromonas enteropelogenes TaxID=29489 RepID=UPI003B9F1A94